ncbi:MAG: hypothetical protein ACTSYL_03795 [Candidatus Thorarchaeota archaeon]
MPTAVGGRTLDILSNIVQLTINGAATVVIILVVIKIIARKRGSA